MICSELQPDHFQREMTADFNWVIDRNIRKVHRDMKVHKPKVFTHPSGVNYLARYSPSHSPFITDSSSIIGDVIGQMRHRPRGRAASLVGPWAWALGHGRLSGSCRVYSRVERSQEPGELAHNQRPGR